MHRRACGPLAPSYRAKSPSQSPNPGHGRRHPLAWFTSYLTNVLAPHETYSSRVFCSQRFVAGRDLLGCHVILELAREYTQGQKLSLLQANENSRVDLEALFVVGQIVIHHAVTYSLAGASDFATAESTIIGDRRIPKQGNHVRHPLSSIPAQG